MARGEYVYRYITGKKNIMEKTTFGLLVALGAAAATPASANAPANAAYSINHPTSVAELLDPVADPVATLSALQAQHQNEPVEVAQNGLYLGPNGLSMHHHHHHHYRHRGYYNHRRHHHHHHHNNYYNNNNYGN